VLDLADLLGSWELHLRAERKSAQTVKSYGDGVRAYLKWCSTNGKPAALDRRQLREFIDGLLTSGPSRPPQPRGISRCDGFPPG
jgi:site-specific recombinase XerD